MSTDKRTEKTSAQEAREIGAALKLLRERRGITQERASQAAGVTRTAWQNYENGRPVVLRTDLQGKLARALGATREQLLACQLEMQHGQIGGHAAGLEEPAQIFAGPGRQQAIFPTAQGDVIVTYPSHLTREGYQELANYFALFLKRAE